MALPTAQLGGMPNINVPSYVPVVQIEKRVPAWQTALMGLLANAGGAVLSKGIENSMAQDFAPQPASGFSKFWNGPTIGAQRAHELDQQSMEQAKMDEAARQNRLNRMVDQTNANRLQTSRLGQQNLEAERLMAGIEKDRGDSSLRDQAAATDVSHQQVQDLIARINMERQGQLAGAQTEHLKATTKEAEAQAAQRALQTRMMSQYDPTNQQATNTGVNPNIAKFAQTAKPSAPDPVLDPVIATLRQQVAQPLPPKGGFQMPVSDEEAAAQALALQRILGLVP